VLERISVPSEIATLRETDPPRARAIQLRISEQFEAAFGRDLAVIGFERSQAEGNYLLGTLDH
jgi:predicted GNAT superfamily acetyltransferase